MTSGRRLGANQTLAELLSLRKRYQRSFAFVIRCLPTVARLHLRTARDNRFSRAAAQRGTFGRE